MKKPYKYHLRPGYGSNKLLIEFILKKLEKEFAKDLFETLKDINPKVNIVEDLWMNDEILLHISSDKGSFLLSKDSWGFAFIIAEENQFVIEFIDNILNYSSMFEKEEVDFENYRNLKT